MIIMTESDRLICQICGNTAQCKFRNHQGYQKSLQFDIYHCDRCFTAFASPLKVDESIYDLIYDQVEQVPGYERYLRYSSEIQQEPDPLSYLAKEDIYWSVSQYLQKRKNSHSLKICEVGCGFGYLTYALDRAGYNVVGIDISQVAVEKARQNYGDLFIHTDIKDYANTHTGKFDVVIATEVIEHISEVKEFLKEARNLLAPGGDLIITTPNRTPYPSDILWETEPPPVHLWWFSEKSMTYLAQALGFNLALMDFTDYTIAELDKTDYFLKPYLAVKEYQPSRYPRLNEQGHALDLPNWISTPLMTQPSSRAKVLVKQILHSIGFISILQSMKKAAEAAVKEYKKMKTRRFLKKNRPSRPTLCAILQKPKNTEHSRS